MLQENDDLPLVDGGKARSRRVNNLPCVTLFGLDAFLGKFTFFFTFFDSKPLWLEAVVLTIRRRRGNG